MTRKLLIALLFAVPVGLTAQLSKTDGTVYNPPLTLASGTITTSAPILNLTQTWNASLVTFTGIKLNVTNTASAIGSLLLDLQVGGTSQVGVGSSLYSGNGVSLYLNGIEGGGEPLLFTQTGFTEYTGDNPHEIGSLSSIDADEGGLYWYGVASGVAETSPMQFQSRVAETPFTLPAGTPHFLFSAGRESTNGHQHETLFAVDNDFKNDDPDFPRFPFALYELHGEVSGGFTDSVTALGLNVAPGAIGAVQHILNPATQVNDAPKNYVVTLIEGRADQVADLQEWKLTGGSVLTKVDKDGKVTATDFVVASTSIKPLRGTSASLGGGALLAGVCATNATTVTGATTAMAVDVSPVTYPGAGATWDGYVSGADTVTTRVCAIVGLTPTASTYNIAVIP